MNNGITVRNACIIAFMFYISNAYMWGSSHTAGRDSWIFVLSGMVIYCAVMVLYAAVSSNDPGKDLFSLFDVSFCKFFAKLFSIAYILYGFAVLYATTHFYTDFIATNILQRTPRTVILGAIILTCVIMACTGRSSIGWWSSFFIIPVVFLCLFDLIFSLGKIEADNLLPILYNKENILPNIASSLVFPFGEIVILFSVYGGVEKRGKSYAMWVLPWIAANVLTALVYARNAAVLGEPLNSTLAFSTYFVQSIVSVSAELQRVEVLISVIIWFANIVCGAAALMFASHGVMQFTRKKCKKPIIIFIGAAVFILSMIKPNSAVDIMKLVDKVKFYLIILQLFGPAAVFASQCLKRSRSIVKRR